MIARLQHFFSRFNLELFVWIAGLTILALIDVSPSEHFSICPLKNLGFDFCPGCGLGASLHYLFHLQLKNSFNAHPLGVFALVVLLFRIWTLIKSTIINKPEIIK